MGKNNQARKLARQKLAKLREKGFRFTNNDDEVLCRKLVAIIKPQKGDIAQ